LHALGLEYGPAFRGVEELLVEPGAAQGSVQLPSSAGDAAAYRAHPALLDACLQVAAAALGQEAGGDTLVPVAIAHLALHTRLPKRVAVSAVRGSSTGAQGVSLDLAVSCESGALLTVTGLRVQRLAAKPVEDALGRDAYVVRWIEQARRDGASLSPSRSDVWLVFADAQGVGAAVAGELREQARRCCVVQTGAHFACLAPDRYVISPSEPEHYERLLSELLATSTLRGIVHAFSLDAAAPESITSQSLIADTERGSLSVVMLTQVLARRGFRDPPRLVLLTRGAQAACARGLTSPSQSALWGLTRTLTMEVAELGFVRIDLDPTPERSEARAVVQELLSDDEEDQVALRAGSRLVARLSQSPLPPALPVTFHQDGCYLITGGLGGLGLSVASFMVSQGARHIVLLSRRSAIGANERAALAELEANGATVRFMTADVAKPQDIGGVLEELARSGPPLRGVLHLAASLDDRTVLSMDEAAFWTPFAPKVLGAWNLHVATLGLPLDFFVLYSSAAALLGSPGQSNYAAANAFLDALAQLRKSLGLPAVSIQWGPFSEVGLAAATAARGERLGLHGIRSMTPDEGNTLLGRLIAQPMAEVGLVHLTFRELVQLYPRLGSAPFYAGLDRGPAQGRGPALLRAELAQTPAEQRYAQLEHHVLTLLAKTLRRTPESVDVRAPLQTLGLDSLMSLELKSALETALDLTLSSTLLYTYTSVDALVPYLLSQLAFASAIAEPLPAQDGDLDGLDADGLMAALDQQLAAIRTRRN
jgi:NAD(P)-dependent dehydrogenase (short-subunit alcohol dehydrogenase family)/acyl carrier protein